MSSYWMAYFLLLITPVGGAVLMKWCRCPGWAVIGGLLAGIVLGPAVCGRFAPAAYEQWFVGGHAERIAFTEQSNLGSADIGARRLIGSDEASLRATERSHQDRLAELEENLHDATWSYQHPIRIFVLVTLALVFLSSAALRVSRAGTNHSLTLPVSIGVWSAALPGGIAASCAMWFWTDHLNEAILFGAACAVGPWALMSFDQLNADTLERGGARLVQTAGRCSTLIALALTMYVLVFEEPRAHVFGAATLVMVPLSWIVPVSHRDIVRLCAKHVFIPVLSALAILRVDVLLDFSLWPIMLVLLLSGDGRLTGAFIGARVPGGRSPLRTLRLVLGAMAAGPMQLAIATLAMHFRLLSAELVFALVCGAALVEVTGPYRATLARQLSDMEHTPLK